MDLKVKYRPKKLKDLLGNESVKEALKAILARKEGLPSAFLFTGPSGTGKTTVGRIIASHLNAELNEFDTASTRGIDTIREIATNSLYAPYSADVKVYMLDECHKLTNDAQNALLKLLDEPPRDVYFILCTTDPEKLLPTIKTRCQTFEMKLLSPDLNRKLLHFILEKEGKKLSKDVTERIIELAEGCPRQSVVLLDSIIDIEDDQKAMDALYTVTYGSAKTIDICRLLVSNEKDKWKKMRELITNLEDDPERVRYAVLGYLSAILLKKTDDKVADLMEPFLENWYDSKRAGMIYSLYCACRI